MNIQIPEGSALFGNVSLQKYFLFYRYTGHCPTLRFHFGRCYGTKTKEIIKVGYYDNISNY